MKNIVVTPTTASAAAQNSAGKQLSSTPTTIFGEMACAATSNSGSMAHPAASFTKVNKRISKKLTLTRYFTLPPSRISLEIMRLPKN